MILRIEHVAFDHAAGSASNRSVAVVKPDGQPVQPWSLAAQSGSVAAYPLKTQNPRTLLVEAAFSFPNGYVPGISVRAKPANVAIEDILGSTNTPDLPAPGGAGLSTVQCRLTQ